jgi:hypothetical protein
VAQDLEDFADRLLDVVFDSAEGDVLGVIGQLHEDYRTQLGHFAALVGGVRDR